MPSSLQPHGLQPTRLLCQWDFPDKNIGVGCHFLLQGIFPTQGVNLASPEAPALPLSHWGHYFMQYLLVNYPYSHGNVKTLKAATFSL